MSEKDPNKTVVKENLHSGHRERLRNKLTHMDTNEMEHHELLEFMLFSVIPRGNTNELAHRLLNHFNGSLSGVLNASIDELVKIKGVGIQTALFLHTIPILTRLYQKLSNAPKPRLTAENLSDYCFSATDTDDDECFVIVLLNASNEIMYEMKTRRECLSADSLINIRAVLKHILPYSPASILFVHKCNYENKTVHKNVVSNFKILSANIRAINITFVDYIIIHGDNITSMTSDE